MLDSRLDPVYLEHCMRYNKCLKIKGLTIPKNKIKFQKGQSLPEFLESYGTDQKCEDALFQARCPEGFQCPACGYEKYCHLRTRKVFAVHPLQAPGVAHRGHFVRQHQAAVTHLVPRHVPRHAVQERHLGDGSEASARSELQHGLDGQAQADAGHAGAGRQPAVAGHGGAGRRLPGISNDSLARLLILDTMFQTHLK